MNNSEENKNIIPDVISRFLILENTLSIREKFECLIKSYQGDDWYLDAMWTDGDISKSLADDVFEEIGKYKLDDIFDWYDIINKDKHDIARKDKNIKFTYKPVPINYSKSDFEKIADSYEKGITPNIEDLNGEGLKEIN